MANNFHQSGLSFDEVVKVKKDMSIGGLPVAFTITGQDCWINDDKNSNIQHSANVLSEDKEKGTIVVEFMNEEQKTVPRHSLFPVFRTDPNEKFWTLRDDETATGDELDSTIDSVANEDTAGDLTSDDEMESCEDTATDDYYDDDIEVASGHNLLKIHGLLKDDIRQRVRKVLPKSMAPFSFNVGHFFLYIYERQCIWERRNKACEPFTDDYVLGNYFFCNNYRELDRGTTYFHAHAVNLFEKYSKNGFINEIIWLEKILWASICYRLVNKIETFLEFGGIPEVQNWPAFEKYFLSIDPRKVKFTGAHQTMGERRYCETMNILDHNSTMGYANMIIQKSKAGELKKCCDILEMIPNIGRFLGWQIACDLLESKCIYPCVENDYATLGKGAEVGISNICVGGIEEGYKRKENGLRFAKLLRETSDDVYKAMGLVFPRFHGLPLTLKHIEHALCEYQKFISISSQYEQGITPKGQRTVNLCRSNLDLDKCCHYFSKCGNCDDVIMCDFCLVAYCSECVTHTSLGATWRCHRCCLLEAMQFY